MLLATVVVLRVSAIAMDAVFSYVSRYVMNALQAKDAAEFYHLMLLYVVWIVFFVPMAAFYPYLSGKLAIEWREWMTRFFVDLSFQGHALYTIMRDRRVDNPDQRIGEDLNSFTTGALQYSMAVLGSLLTAATFFGILWSISRLLAVCLIGYALLGTWITILIGRRLVVINFNQQRYEADYRFALVHARNNAEAIALYNGERDEARQLSRRFEPVLRNFLELIHWQRNLDFFTASYSHAAGLVPYFVLAGAYFSGRFELGEFTQAAFAFGMLKYALSLVVERFESLSDYASVINRLAAFKEQCEAAVVTNGAPQVEVSEGERLEVADLALVTPDGRRVVQTGLNFSAAEGEPLMITGPSGAGKTTLVRAIADLWREGKGRIVRPPLDRMLILPQRPYMILGTLRDQLCYPRADSCSDQELMAALAEVNLADLPARWGGLNSEANWGEVLSIGEQQRLAFARLLLNRPRWAILDEATSALDVRNEENLYAKLARLHITAISISHRPSLRQFHARVVQLTRPAVEPVTDGSAGAAALGG
jgi:putative ATP-binding cassette transporter